ncbi:DgyrCDS4511 [Dimorphilus gyrociliatus]|uniref:DgyrCDS4511 n=1 Tax=Dimorphilus gyrociliatus TaxID=2664684 RepID=A0A7I8VGS2_9ANNE|nr:DgyrCDS4511 [Dimorphilus gyrociliatus]
MLMPNFKDPSGYCNNYGSHKINRCSLLTSLECTCTGKDSSNLKSKQELFSSSSDTESESDDDDTDGRFTLADLLKGVLLFEKRHCKNLNAMKKLIMNFDGVEDLNETDSVKIFDYLNDSRKEIKQIGCLIIGQLCKNEDNTFKFLYHRLAERMIEFLNIEYMRESSLFTLEKIAKHKSLAEMWITDENVENLFKVIKMLLKSSCDKEINLAILNCLKAFSFHKKLANIIMDDTNTYLRNQNPTSKDFKEVYADLMGNLLLACDSSKMSILKSSALPHCISMIKTGNCFEKKRALQFFVSLMEENGIVCILDSDLIQYIISAFLFCKCSKVEEVSLLIISKLISAKERDVRQKVLREIYHQFRSDDENINRFEFLYNIVFNRFRKLARIEKDESSKDVFVRLIPSIDVDSSTLNRISYLIRIIYDLISYENGYFDDRSEISRIDDLTGNGLLYIIDLLRVYSLQPKLTVRSINNEMLVRPTSGRRQAPQSALNIHNMLQTSEIQLVIDLLKLIYFISKFGGKKVENLQDTVEQKPLDSEPIKEATEECEILTRSIRFRLLQSGTIQAVGPWLSCRHSMIKKYAVEILENLSSPVTEISRPIPPPKDTKDRSEILRDALNSMSEDSANIIENALGGNIRIRSACVNSIRKRVTSFRPMSAIVKGKNELVNEVYTEWKPKINYNETILNQCLEQIKEFLLPLLYSLLTSDEVIKISILQFLYTLLNYQTVNIISITDYGGVKVLLDCVRIWDEASGIDLLRMYIRILHEIIKKEMRAKEAFLKFDGIKVLCLKQRIVKAKPYISEFLQNLQTIETPVFSQEKNQPNDVWAKVL